MPLVVDTRVPVRGSARRPPHASHSADRTPRDVIVELTLHVRRRADLRHAQLHRRSTPLSHDEHASRHGAHDDDLERVWRFAGRHDLTVGGIDRAARTVVCRGEAAAVERAFAVELIDVEHARGRHRSHQGPAHVPQAIADAIEGVLGLDTRPAGAAHIRHFTAAHRRRRTRLPPDLAHYLPARMATLYRFPDGFDGAGQCIGLIELDGGFRHSDLDASFRRMRMAPPAVVIQRVHRGANRPDGRPMGADSEVVLDLVMAGAAAPGARLVAYFAPWDERGFVDAVKAAVHDTVNRPAIVSISWGNPEPDWSRQAVRLMNETLRDAAALGITVCASSGDQGAASGLTSGVAVNFPASSPYALACGATRTLARGRRIVSERVWNDLDLGFGATGGGTSAIFRRPAYQSDVDVPGRTGRQGRGVPDVAANGDPETGYVMRVDGKWLRLGGTSAVAPLWAGLIARVNQAAGRRLGLVHREIYPLCGTRAFRAITRGNNGVFRAARIWNACTGLGSPRADRLLNALTSPHGRH